jgi:hypothetical protein
MFLLAGLLLEHPFIRTVPDWRRALSPKSLSLLSAYCTLNACALLTSWRWR